jgi:phosphate-selective porin OprO/OprP
MDAKRIAFAAGLGCIVLLVAARDVWGEEPRVVDQLLDILRKNKQITEQQYRDLKQKAEEERQQDLRKAAGAPPSPSPSPAALAAAPTAAAPTPMPDSLRAYFKNGFVFETADGNYRIAPIVLTQLDWNVSVPDTALKQAFKLQGTSTGVQFRRARLGFQGIVFGNIDYKFEYDFAEATGGQPSFKDVYMGMSQIPFVQYVRVGHFKEPFSLEELTPDTYTTFMERASNNAFANPGSNIVASGTDRNTGFAIYQTYFDQHLTGAAGGFRLTNNFGNGFGTDSPYDVTARVTGLPMYDLGKSLVHLGFSYSHKFRHYAMDSQETISFSSRAEDNQFPVNLVNTGQIPTNGADLIDPELAFVAGPFSAQGEYTWAFIDQSSLMCTSATACTRVNHSHPVFDGGYVEAAYFLTGESRASFYRTQFGHFERVIPAHSFTIDGKNWGAWQVAARFSHLNLDSASINGGALDDITGGVNWYLNSVTRVTVNYVWAHRESIGDSNSIEGRFQLAF